MTNGSDPTGLESADAGSSSDSGPRWSARILAQLLAQAAEALEVVHEYKAAGEVRDARGRIIAEEETRAARERLSGGEGVHGEDSPQAEVTRTVV